MSVSDRGYVDIRAFGAIGDNVTDDTAAFQAAVHALILPGQRLANTDDGQ
jgi:polygalacturonase